MKRISILCSILAVFLFFNPMQANAGFLCGGELEVPCILGAPPCHDGLKVGALGLCTLYCGGEWELGCWLGSCDPGKAVRADSLCHAECGGDGEVACEFLVCDEGNTLQPLTTLCTACGGEDQIECLNFVTNEFGCDEGLAVRADLKCHAECGGAGQVACEFLTCDDGYTLEPFELTPRCVECGGHDQIGCFNLVTQEFGCKEGHTADPENITRCKRCGGVDEWICVDLDKPCNDPWLRPETVGDVVPYGFKCRRKWHAQEPDCDCNAVVEAQPARGPVYGIADTHTHQFANMAFGGAMLWGKPFDERGINAALAWGDFTWDFPTVSYFDPLPIPIPLLGYEVHFDVGAGIGRVATGEGEFFHSSFEGANSFAEWPRWNTTMHQQMYHGWLERAYRGGLRLMVMLTVNNEVLCELPIARKRFYWDKTPLPGYECSDMFTVDQQLAEIKAMEKYIDLRNDGEENGNGWYKIVYSPYEARQAIREGKMAVVLGIEVDGLFGCEKFGECTPEYISGELQKYYGEGVRHLFPIHLYDNSFGGTAVYHDLWPFTSMLATNELPMFTGDCEFVKEALDINGGPLAGETAEYEFKLIATEMTKWLLEQIDVEFPTIDGADTGHCNLIGLTNEGQYLIEEMMNMKMIVDIDHLSLLSLDWVLGEAQARDYPLISSHSFLFERPLTEKGIANPPSEGHRTAKQIELIRDLGGIVAPLNPRYAGSSTLDYAHMYRYAVDKMKKSPDDKYPGIAFATDWGAMYQQTAPRCADSGDCLAVEAPDCKPYDSDNCENSTDPDCLEFVSADYPQPGCEGTDFPKLEYGENGDYNGFEAVGVGGRFKRQATGARAFDFNKDGLAHVGLLPDFIKDLTNVGLTEEELEPLFHSAEAYIRMWEKINGGPPEITAIIDGLKNDNGEYVTDVNVKWNIISEAEVRETDGCGEIDIDYDTAGGVELTCWVATDGGEAEETILIVRITDQDNDGVSDDTDNCPTDANADQNNYDGDQMGDICDPDDDNDGISDDNDRFPLDETEWADNDNDGIGDNADTDDDNDNVLDADDNDPLNNYICRDVDTDSCDDCSNGTDNPADDGLDTDADGLCNAGDPDDDNDGVADGSDSAPLDNYQCRDVDGDTCDDCSSGTDKPTEDGVDTDADGACNAGDPDDDNDGVEDGSDADPLDRFRCNDADADTCDDCLKGYTNPADDGTDTDADGLCNIGDPDDDNDGVADGLDSAPLNNFQCRDADSDACDDCTSGTDNPTDDGTDTDVDGMCDAGDNCIEIANSDQVDTDSDGMGDACDICPKDPENDADNDSVCGDIDQCIGEDAIGFDADSDGCIDTINGLESSVETLVADDVIDANMQESVVSKLENAVKSVDKENICAAVNQLEAFINQVEAQKGKKISEAAADELIIYTNSVINHQLSQLHPDEGC